MLIEGFLREAVEQIEDGAVREHLLGRLGRHRQSWRNRRAWR